MNTSTPIHKDFLREFLATIEIQSHHIYALMTGLPKENCHLFRFYDRTNRADGYKDVQNNTFSIAEFNTRFDAIHPEEPFGINFSVHLDRVDYDRAAQYEETVSISCREEATRSELDEMLDDFLEAYCERCLRDNRPFELTPEVVDKFGFTSADRAVMEPLLTFHNTNIRKRIRAEFDALLALDFIRERIR